MPPKRRYPRSVHLKFLATCEAGKAASASCECVVVKQELLSVEKAQSIAELLILEAALSQRISLAQIAQQHVPMPERVKRTVEQCNTK